MLLNHDRDLAMALRGALVGATGLLAISILPADSSWIAQAGILLAIWLCLGSMLVYVAEHRTRPQRVRLPLIPLHFSGPTGRFTLRRRGDGRQVEIVSDGVVLAEVKATDLRDEIELHEAVASEEIEELGSAIAQAIEIVSDADEAHLDWDDHGASEDWETDEPRPRGW
jgi:hypothetical protein